MKVILRTDIENLGSIGEIVNVKPGYARNYLLPQGYAYVADKGNLRRFEDEKMKLMATSDRESTRAEALKTRIEAQSYLIEAKTGDQGRMYGSVTSRNIAALLEESGIEIDRRRIVLETPIKTLGDFEIPIKLYGSIQAKVKLSIIDGEAHIRAAIEAEVAASEAAERGEVVKTEKPEGNQEQPAEPDVEPEAEEADED